jgi:hypothetical protein
MLKLEILRHVGKDQIRNELEGSLESHSGTTLSESASVSSERLSITAFIILVFIVWIKLKILRYIKP